MLLQQASRFIPGVTHAPHQLLYWRYLLRSRYLISNILCTQLQAVCLPIRQHRTRNSASSKSDQWLQDYDGHSFDYFLSSFFFFGFLFPSAHASYKQGETELGTGGTSTRRTSQASLYSSFRAHILISDNTESGLSQLNKCKWSS